MQVLSKKNLLYTSVLLITMFTFRGHLSAMDGESGERQFGPWRDTGTMKEAAFARSQHQPSTVPLLADLALKPTVQLLRDLVQSTNLYNYRSIWNYCNSLVLLPAALQKIQKLAGYFCCARTMQFPMPISAMAANYDKNVLFIAGKAGVSVIANMNGQGTTFNTTAQEDLKAVQCSRDGQWAVLAGYNDIYICDLNTKQPKVVLQRAHEQKSIESLLFLHNDSFLVSSGHDGRICFWNIDGITHKKLLDKDVTNNSPLIIKLEYELKVAHDGTMSFWRFAAGSGPVHLVYEKKGSRGQSLKGAVTRAFNLPDDVVIRSMQVSKDETRLAAVVENSIMVWDISNLDRVTDVACIDNPHGSAAVSTIFFMDKRKALISAGGDGTVNIWDISDASNPKTISTFVGHGGPINMVTTISDGNLLISAGADKVIKMWDISNLLSPKYLSTLQGHTESVNAVLVREDKDQILSASADKTIKVWEPATFSYTIMSKVMASIVDNFDKEKEQGAFNEMLSWVTQNSSSSEISGPDTTRYMMFLQNIAKETAERLKKDTNKKYTKQEIAAQVQAETQKYNELIRFTKVLSATVKSSAQQKASITDEVGYIAAGLAGIDTATAEKKEITEMYSKLRPHELQALQEQYLNLLKKFEAKAKARVTPVMGAGN